MFLLSAILIYLVLAAQFESFRDRSSFAGSVPLAVAGALLFSFLTDAQHLQPGGPDHARGPGREERHPHRAVRESPAGAGKDKLAAIVEAAADPLRPILMTTAATVMGHFLVIATGPGPVPATASASCW